MKEGTRVMKGMWGVAIAVDYLSVRPRSRLTSRWTSIGIPLLFPTSEMQARPTKSNHLPGLNIILSQVQYNGMAGLV